jgi:hypothetical protein
MVKDPRTQEQTGDVNRVLDGDIDLSSSRTDEEGCGRSATVRLELASDVDAGTGE